MSQQQQTSATPLLSMASEATLHNNRWVNTAGFAYKSRPWQVVLLSALMAVLTSCSEDQTNSQTSEEPISQTAAEEAESTPATEEVTTDNTTSGGQLTGAGSRYRVTAETAYFFDTPEQGKPSGKYLLRGDVIYGEQESNGFVKTRFKNPNGATVTGWLKVQELSKLAASPTSVAARTRRPTQAPSAPPTISPADDTYEGEQASSTPVEAAEADASGNATAVVQVARSYFYNSPDLTQPRKAHCVRGDKVRLGESRGDAVFVTFTNWEKVTTTGWMRRDALR
ncbi:hypothetical protein [Hymenobacter volaticus]|uniref:SH3 domain-containing protein n=1 Tax=Hymenobacter volaticus TaxID=2932254 RepID=A0ABY4GAS1_9BACT|nr:hypothetical protein [Hymenobacter volaticus]UOQ67669.1 hypothetical protein MUN86_07350 [Hymenobacter volaticus]